MMVRSIFANLLPFVVAIGLTLNHFVTPASAGDKFHTLLLLEQGFSSIQNRARQPLSVPFGWIENACIIDAKEESRKLVSDYLALLTELGGHEVHARYVNLLSECNLNTNLFVKFSSDRLWFTEDLQVIQNKFEHSQVVPPDPGNFSTGIAMTDGASLVYAGVVWNDHLPLLWNRSVAIEELFQGTTAGLDVSWAGDFFSILQEIDPYTINPEVPLTSEVASKYTSNNATALCRYDAFAIFAISQYVKSDETAGLFNRTSSLGLITYVNQNFDYLSMRFDEMNVIQRYPGLFDTRCI